MQKQGHEVAFRESRWRQRAGRGRACAPCGRLESAGTSTRSLQLLCLDPELSGVYPESAGRLSREGGCLLGIADLREQERDARMRRAAPARRREIVLLERVIEHE